VRKIVYLLAGLLGIGIIASFLTVRLTDSAEFCASCHVMRPVYQVWQHSAHSSVANCNTCHVPHNLVLKPLYKAKSGMWDSYVFFTGQTPLVLEAKKDTKRIVIENCLECHGTLLRNVNMEGRDCIDCHRYTPHGIERRSIQESQL
jgi:cytochrome c nitrite reductase small subunit